MTAKVPVVFAALLGILPLAVRLPGQFIFFMAAAALALAADAAGLRGSSRQHARKPAAVLSDPLLPFALLLLVMALASLRSRNSSLAALELIVWGTGLLIAYSLPRLARLKWHGHKLISLRALLIWASVGGAAVAAYGLADFLIQMSSAAPGQIYRTSSFLLDPQLASAYLALSIPVATAFHLEASRPGERLLWGFAAVLMAAGLTATYTRAGWLGALAGVALLGALVDRRLWLKAAVVTLLLAVTFPGVTSRFASSGNVSTDTSNTGRITLWRAALITFGEHPAAGAGLGNYPLELARLAQERPDIKPFGDTQYPHNSLLFVMAETGLAGAIPFLWLAFLLLWRQAHSFVRLRRQPGGALAEVSGHQRAVLAAGGLAALVSFGIHTNFQSLLHSPIAATPFWITATALLALADEGTGVI